MDIKLAHILVGISLYLISAIPSCRKNNCFENVYSFEAGIKAYPDNDSIQINDTIWLELNMPVNLKNLNTGNQVDFSNAENLGTSIDFVKFTGGSVNNPGVIAAANNFDYAVIEGVFVTDNLLPEKNRDFNFKVEGGMYKFKLAIIAKQPGIFALGIHNAANVFRKHDKCTKASFRYKFIDTDNHIYFLQQNRPGYTPSGLELTNLYCFKVI